MPQEFSLTTIALILDVHRTLASRDIEPILEAYEMEEGVFWERRDKKVEEAKRMKRDVSIDFLCITTILELVGEGTFKDLSLEKLYQLGKEIQFYPGLPDFLRKIKQEVNGNPIYAPFGIRLEIYLLSSGIAETLRGSRIADYVDEITANEFLERDGRIAEISLPVTPESKVGYLDKLSQRIPVENMIYVGDGRTDVPCFRFVKNGGGVPYVVFDPAKEKYEIRAEQISRELGIQRGPTDYRDESETAKYIRNSIRDIANRKREVFASG